MSDHQTNDSTTMLKAWSDGDEATANQILLLVYESLQNITAEFAAGENLN